MLYPRVAVWVHYLQPAVDVIPTSTRSEYEYQGSVFLKFIQMPYTRIRSNAHRHDGVWEKARRYNASFLVILRNFLYFVILRNEVTKNPLRKPVPA